MAAKKTAADEAAVTTVAAPMQPVQDGVAVVAERAEPTLDPDLAKIRDDEAARMGSIEIAPRPEPTIDPALEAARDAEIKRQADAVKAASK